MRNYKQPGNILELTAPAGGVVSGQGYLIGALFVVAVADAVAGELFRGQTVGVFRLTKVAAQVVSEGDTIGWDDTGKEATNLTAADMVIGVAASPAAGPDAVVEVKLNDIGNPADPAQVALYQPFVSAEQTGTGAPQNIAHGLGATPGNVVVNATDLAPVTTGDFTVAEGAHDATDVILTVTLNKKYKVTAYR